MKATAALGGGCSGLAAENVQSPNAFSAKFELVWVKQIPLCSVQLDVFGLSVVQKPSLRPWRVADTIALGVVCV